MAILHLESLPPRATKSSILRLLIETARVPKPQIGRIELERSTAMVQVPEKLIERAAKALDGAVLDRSPVWCWIQRNDQDHPGDEHFERLANLLELESKADRSSSRRQSNHGTSLSKLVIKTQDSGLAGRVLVTLVSKTPGAKLPWSSFRVGSPVCMVEENVTEVSPWYGVVSAINHQRIEVALARWPEPIGDSPTFRLEPTANEVARQRERRALTQARSARGDRLAQLRGILLGQAKPMFGDLEPWAPLDQGLNATQCHAVEQALSAKDVAIIHGPPGTGKTTTIVEMIRQSVRRGQRVLACAPSNLAVDNLLERLLANKEKALRLGHPARVLTSLRDHTLDVCVQSHPDLHLARKLTREAQKLFAKADRFTRAKPAPGERRALRDEARSMLEDARSTQDQLVQELIDGADILCATFTGLDPAILGNRTFDLAVVDEAGQSTEPSCWIPIVRSGKVVLTGDHCQLPPTVISREALDGGYDLSLMQRLVAQDGEQISCRLDTQYRMHEAIMGFPSNEFYDGCLKAHGDVHKALLSQLDGVMAHDLTDQPIDFIDTAGGDYGEEPGPDGFSLMNLKESHLVCRKVGQLIELGVKPIDIAVICPYAAQAQHVRENLNHRDVEVDTVDGFQGREKTVVVISLVRSNHEGQIGFLEDVRRMNVALTRARRKLIVIGDSATIAAHPFYERLVTYFDKIGAYRSVWEEDLEVPGE